MCLHPELSRGLYPEQCRVHHERSRGVHIHIRLSSRLRSTNSFSRVYPERSRGLYPDRSRVYPERSRGLYPERSRGVHILTRLSSRLRSTSSLWSPGAVTRIPPQRGEMFFTPSEAEVCTPSGAEGYMNTSDSRLGFARRTVCGAQELLLESRPRGAKS